MLYGFKNLNCLENSNYIQTEINNDKKILYLNKKIDCIFEKIDCKKKQIVIISSVINEENLVKWKNVIKSINNETKFLGNYFVIEINDKSIKQENIEIIRDISTKMEKKSKVIILLPLKNDVEIWDFWFKISRNSEIGLALSIGSIKIVDSLFTLWYSHTINFLCFSDQAFSNECNNFSFKNENQCKTLILGGVTFCIVENSKHLNFVINFCNNLKSSILTHNLLLKPLKPLSENLTSEIYDVFEKDSLKYNQYEKAIDLAIQDLISFKSIKCIKIIIVGPGKGPLISKLIKLIEINDYESEFEIIAVEKNPNCRDILIKKNSDEWKNKVSLFFNDIRNIDINKIDPHIVISEMLGSFGDNELCPEILFEFNKFGSKQQFIMIPTSYSNYLQPVFSDKLFDQFNINRPYYVKLNKYHAIDEAKHVWTFNHPDLNLMFTEKEKKLKFHAKYNCRINGFYGYFECNLYGYLNFNIHEKSNEFENITCTSWYPIIFPVNDTIVKKDSVIKFKIKRLINKNYVWYEWTFNNKIYNSNGHDYSMKLN